MSGAGPHGRRTQARSLGRALSLLLLSVGIGLAVVSCGGDGQLSQQEYDRELSEIGREIDGASEGVREELRNVGRDPASLEQAAERLDEAQSRLDRAADELEGMEPPDDAVEAHDELVEGLNDLEAEFGDFRDALESGNVRTIEQFVQDLDADDAVERVERAIAELERQGYEIRPGE